MKIDNKQLINKYYTALMLYLVFTFADTLLQGLIPQVDSLELWMYTLLGLSLIIQTTLAYKHIMVIKEKAYSTCALVSDSIDIGFSIFICAAISSTINEGTHHLMDNYLFLSIPFLLLSINQFIWYIIVREYNPRAILQLLIFFVGTLVATVFGLIYPGVWFLTFLALWHFAIMAIFRRFGKAPKSFTTAVKPMWYSLIERPLIKKLFPYKYSKQPVLVRSVG